MTDSTTTTPAETSVDEDAPVTVADKPREPSEYEKQLRREAAKFRRERDVARAEVETRTAAERAGADQKVADATRAFQDRLIRAELKAEALKNGIVDLDGLRMADLSGVKLNDAGEVEGGAELIAKLKETKPYLFATTGAQTGTTSSTATPPSPKPGAAKSATEMTDAEYAAAKAAAMGRR